jgi:thiol-disulfide isomerase/thioredoxin
MKVCLIFLACFVSLFGYTQQNDIDLLKKSIEVKKSVAMGKPYCKFSFVGEEKSIRSEDIVGKVTFINFWYASCAPCMGEIEALNILYDSFSNNTNFKFISFTFENNKKILEIKKKYNIRFPVTSITDTECDRLNYYLGFPVNIILNDSGVVKYINPGASLDKKENIDYFKKALYPIIVEELNKPKPIPVKQSSITQF